MKLGAGEQSRRKVLIGAAAFGAAVAIGSAPAAAAPSVSTKPIPSSGERLPVIGMGSWITFDVGEDKAARAERVKVLQAFFDAGGAVVDSSPMYMSAQEVIGHCLAQIANKDGLFAATKVWTPGKELGIGQMRGSQNLWGVERFDLLQIHNMLDWETHLGTLLDWKQQGRVRYVGITTSHGRRHDDMEQVMKTQPFDFVQFTYNILDREAEERLLPLAAERGLAVIVNRPFRRGDLIERLAGKPLPEWAAEIGCANWPQFLLKFAVSHPAVTCAIPATSRPDHMGENMGAAAGALPDGAMRERMIDYVESL
jgi:diketogulonate reductase-like aldo/keto reductase